jgi:hypothetical protein
MIINAISYYYYQDIGLKPIMPPLVRAYLKKLANGETSFRGKMIIVANDLEFPNFQFPELPGVWIEMDKTAMLDYIKKRIDLESR